MYIAKAKMRILKTYETNYYVTYEILNTAVQLDVIFSVISMLMGTSLFSYQGGSLHLQQHLQRWLMAGVLQDCTTYDSYMCMKKKVCNSCHI